MKVLIQRFIDDGYGKVHLIEEGVFDRDFFEEIKKAGTDSDVYELLLEKVPETDIDMYSIGNPKGYGNAIDEYRIYVDGQHYKTV
jgi:hypothetical protein